MTHVWCSTIVLETFLFLLNAINPLKEKKNCNLPRQNFYCDSVCNKKKVPSNTIVHYAAPQINFRGISHMLARCPDIVPLYATVRMNGCFICEHHLS